GPTPISARAPRPSGAAPAKCTATRSPSACWVCRATCGRAIDDRAHALLRRPRMNIATSPPRLVDLDDESFNPFALERLSHGDADDPYPLIHELAAQATVHKGAYRNL